MSRDLGPLTVPPHVHARESLEHCRRWCMLWRSVHLIETGRDVSFPLMLATYDRLFPGKRPSYDDLKIDRYEASTVIVQRAAIYAR